MGSLVNLVPCDARNLEVEEGAAPLLGVGGGDIDFTGLANSDGKLSELVLVLRRTNFVDGSDGTVATIFFSCAMAAQRWSIWVRGHSSFVASEINRLEKLRINQAQAFLLFLFFPFFFLLARLFCLSRWGLQMLIGR